MPDCTIAYVLSQAAGKLLDSKTSRLDAELLLCSILKKPRSYLFTWPEQLLTETQILSFQQLIEQRQQGIPVAYLTGSQDFWSLQLQVNDSVLIPRPETELLVERALACNIPDNAIVADLGTGSGAIALALAREKPLWKIWAVDKSAAALDTARHNAQCNNIHTVQFLEGSWCHPLIGQKLHMIVSNPPYICNNDHHLREGDVRFEPKIALASGHDGLNDIRLITQQASRQLLPEGWLLVEHGFDQHQSVQSLFQEQGFTHIMTYQDIAGLDRVTTGSKTTVSTSL
ncbi:Release factor glutamine methyltransferase [invertebrate metagenome]|uniref:peptide chain release factor N(5)-glutamine methyltransferase n=1 Tax=invertebrate metagenome TaxID=1711999 RepID=A0A2H9T930_9ZZZZ